jgi:hypothetical protein
MAIADTQIDSQVGTEKNLTRERTNRSPQIGKDKGVDVKDLIAGKGGVKDKEEYRNATGVIHCFLSCTSPCTALSYAPPPTLPYFMLLSLHCSLCRRFLTFFLAFLARSSYANF